MPPDIRVLAFLGRVTRQGLYLGAHVHRGVGHSDLLYVGDRGHSLYEATVPALGLLQPLLCANPLADVPGIDYDFAHFRVAQQVAAYRLQVTPGAIFVAISVLG